MRGKFGKIDVAQIDIDVIFIIKVADRLIFHAIESNYYGLWMSETPGLV